MQERQQKKIGSCDLIWLKMARDEIAPAAQDRDTIPRPVDLKVRLRIALEDFSGSEAGSNGRERLQKTTHSAIHPTSAQHLALENLGRH